MKYCFQLGLIRQGLLHDLSKYSPQEFLAGAKYYQGNCSPIYAEKLDRGYSYGWQHHKGHNPHHWEFWIDDIGTTHPKAIRVPRNYALEMICDWISAGQNYDGKAWTNAQPLNYYNHYRKERLFDPETASFLESILQSIADVGVEAAFSKIKDGSLGGDY